MPDDPSPREAPGSREPAPGGTPRGEPGRARELTRGARRPRPRPADTGRQHHLGGAPADMPVLGEGPGHGARTTRAALVQLADRTVVELRRLETAVEADMARAAAALDFEAAAWHRDELAAVRAELTRRG